MVAHARSYDRKTSHDAADSVTGITGTKRRIIQVFEEYGSMTHEKLIENYSKMWGNSFPASVSGLRSRCKDLVDKGYIVEREDLKV